MPTYAIIGASGKTTKALLGLLLQDPNNNINFYTGRDATHNFALLCNSESREFLRTLLPTIEQNKSVKIFRGAINDIPLLASCISNVDTIFSVAGRHCDPPGARIAEFAAQSIVAALCHCGLAKGAEKVPKVITFTSCPISKIIPDDPSIPNLLFADGLHSAYEDLRAASRHWDLHKSWLRVTLIQPGGLVEDEYKGHALRLFYKDAGSFVTFSDLAVRMIEVAESADTDGVGVSIVPTSKIGRPGWNFSKEIAGGPASPIVLLLLGWLLGIATHRVLYLVVSAIIE